MKKRTIEDIRYDLGNLEFAWFVDIAIKDGYTITNIEEYPEKFEFEMDGYSMEFSKSGDKVQQLESCYRMLFNGKIFDHFMENFNENSRVKNKKELRGFRTKRN